MLYQAGEYAYPALNFFGYAVGYAVLVMSTMGAYSIWKAWQQPPATQKNSSFPPL